MKVRENTADRLRLSGFPVALAAALLLVIAVPVAMSVGYFRAGMTVPGLVLGGIAILMLVGCFGVFVKHRQIEFDRAAESVTVIERGLLGARRTVRSTKGLNGASVQTQVQRAQSGVGHKRGKRPKDRRLFRPMLVYANGRTEPLYETYAENDDASVAATAINGWLGLRPGAPGAAP